MILYSALIAFDLFMIHIWTFEELFLFKSASDESDLRKNT
jgi:hypothetical protein